MNLGVKGVSLVLVLLNQAALLPLLLLEILLYSLGFNLARAAILTSQQYLSLKVIGVLSDFGDTHIRLLEDGTKSLQNSIRLNSTLFNVVLQSLSLVLSDFVLLFRCQQHDLLLFFLLGDFGGLLLILLVVLLLLFLKSHEVGLKQEVLSAHLLHFFKEVLELLRQLFNRNQLLALVSVLHLFLRHWNGRLFYFINLFKGCVYKALTYLPSPTRSRTDGFVSRMRNS